MGAINVKHLIRVVKTGPLLWQGLFIVAPAILLAGIGLVFLRQSQMLAEQEIQARATRLAEDLALVRLPSALWGDLPAFDPTNRASVSFSNLEQDPVFAIASAKLPRIAGVVDVDGRLIFPRLIEGGPSPRPLDEGTLHPSLREDWRLWQTARRSATARSAPPGGAGRSFPQELPADFAAAVEYDLGLESEARGDLEEARKHYEAIVDRFPDVLSESGIPRKTFAGLHLLQLVAKDAAIPARYRSLIADMAADAVLSPSVISESILEKLRTIEGETPGTAQKASRVWSAHQTTRALFQDYLASKTDQTDRAPEWIVWNASPPFLVTQVRDRKCRWLLFVTEDTARRACIECLASQSIPTYFRVAVDLAGRALAQAPGNLPQVAVVDTANRPESPFPRIRARVFLADARAPFAQLRSQASWIRAIIVLSIAAVVTGFAFAMRSFLRQRQLAEQQSNFVSSVSHELRAPIASIRLMAEELVACGPPGGTNDYHGLIAQECGRLSNLIENVLDYSRHERGDRDYRFERVDLATLAEDAARLMRTHAGEKKILIETREARAPVTADVDPKATLQALINLIDNAIKYSPPDSTVRIGAETDPVGTFASLWVEDQGVGIPTNEHKRIFERFYRCGSELRRETKGVGLGLAIVKQVVTAHGGRVILRSEPGRGSRFTLELPVCHVDASERA